MTLLSFNPTALWAQAIPPTILHFEIEDYTPGEPLRIKAIITDDGEIDHALLYFRTPGMSEFDFTSFQTEYEFYIAEVPQEFLEAGTLQYYIYVRDTQGTVRTSPEINPEINPYDFTAVKQKQGNAPDIYLLSPEPGSSVQNGNELIVISLYDPDDDIAVSATRLIIDGKDVTAQAQVTGDIITYSPTTELGNGAHSIEVQAKDKAGNPAPVKKFDFSVAEFKPEKISKVKYNVQTSWETKYDKYDGKEQPLNRPIDQSKPRVKAVIDAGWLKTEAEINYNLYVDEIAQTQAERRQTINRYRLKFATKPLTLTIGDANPRFSELTIKGTRIRGVVGDLKLGFFGLQSFYGESRNVIDPYSISELDSVLTDSIVTDDDTVYIWLKDTGVPTYRREAFGVRTSVTAPRNGTGFMNSFEWGFNYLRFKDDTGDSLSFRNDIINLGNYQYADYDSVELANYLLSIGLMPGDAAWDSYFEQWSADTTAVRNKLGSPKDNIVTSSTMDFRLFGKTYLSLEMAFSLLIDNMYGNRDDIDEILDRQANGETLNSTDQMIADIDELMSNNLDFRINNTLIPLGAIQPAIFADFRTPLPYIPTNLRVNLRHIPDSYNSLGNPSIQSDIDAVKVDTRTRLFKNTTTVSLGGESKVDNLYNSKVVTTTNNTLNAGVGLMLPNLPTLNVNFRMIAREGIKDTTIYNAAGDTIIDSYQVTPTDNVTNTVTISTGYQFKSGEWQFNVNANGMLMTYSDNKDAAYDFDNNSLIFTSSVNFPIPIGFDLGLGRSINAPKINSETTYDIVNFRLNHYMFDRKLTNYAGIDFLKGFKPTDWEPATGASLDNGIDNIKRSVRIGFKWKITNTMSLSMEAENINLSDNIDVEEGSYDENRGKFKWEWRF